MSFGDLLHTAARKHPDAPALVTSEEGMLSYAGLDRQVNALAERLHERGCDAGTRVALYLPRDIFTVTLLLALWRLGAVACPLSTRQPPDESGVTPLLQRNAAWVFVTGTPAAARAAPAGVRVLAREVLAHDLAHDDGPAETDVADFSGPGVAPDRPATLVFTSGSTGTPKAALHTLAAHRFSAEGANERIPLHPGDRWLLSLPLYHVGGLAILFRCLLAGAAVALPPADAPTAEALAQCRATHASLVATQLRRLLREEEDRAPERLQAVVMGGGPLPPALLDEACARGWPLHTSYGCTETAAMATATPPDAPRAALHMAGRPLAYRQLKIAADGEILVRGRTLFEGYVTGNRLERPFDEAGWFHTGDLGALDEKGRLCVEGRADGQFVSGGENIQPEEIERALGRLEGIAQAVVVPVPDEEFGAQPVAFIRAPADADLPEYVDRRLDGLLPRFKIPDWFLPWPDDAPDASGLKPDRVLFQEHARRALAE